MNQQQQEDCQKYNNVVGMVVSSTVNQSVLPMFATIGFVLLAMKIEFSKNLAYVPYLARMGFKQTVACTKKRYRSTSKDLSCEGRHA